MFESALFLEFDVFDIAKLLKQFLVLYFWALIRDALTASNTSETWYRTTKHKKHYGL